MPSAPLVDRRFLEKLERLTIHWQKSFAGVVGGHNRSRFPGAGQEFLDHRQFHHGDDLRAVNWRAYLRLEKLFLKMFQIEPRVPVRMLLDTSVSMDLGAGSKFDYARKLAVALCYVGLVRLDTIAIQSFAQKLGERCISGGGRHQISPVMDFLTALKPQGRTNLFEVARQFLAAYPQRGLLMIISDFLDDQSCERPLQYLADFGHELLLIQVWSEEDRTPPWTGELDLEDAETGARLKLDFDTSARERYTTAFDQYSEILQRVALRNGGRHVGVSTSMSLEEVIFGPLARVRGIA